MPFVNLSKVDKLAGNKLMVEASRESYLLAKGLVAWVQLLGKTAKKALAGVLQRTVLVQELADEDLPDVQMGFGLMNAAGVGFNVSQVKALVYYSLGDNSWAQMVLGYRY